MARLPGERERVIPEHALGGKDPSFGSFSPGDLPLPEVAMPAQRLEVVERLRLDRQDPRIVVKVVLMVGEHVGCRATHDARLFHHCYTYIVSNRACRVRRDPEGMNVNANNEIPVFPSRGRRLQERLEEVVRDSRVLAAVMPCLSVGVNDAIVVLREHPGSNAVAPPDANCFEILS